MHNSTPVSVLGAPYSNVKACVDNLGLVCVLSNLSTLSTLYYSISHLNHRLSSNESEESFIFLLIFPLFLNHIPPKTQKFQPNNVIRMNVHVMFFQ